MWLPEMLHCHRHDKRWSETRPIASDEKHQNITGLAVGEGGRTLYWPGAWCVTLFCLCKNSLDFVLPLRGPRLQTSSWVRAMEAAVIARSSDRSSNFAAKRLLATEHRCRSAKMSFSLLSKSCEHAMWLWSEHVGCFHFRVRVHVWYALLYMGHRAEDIVGSAGSLLQGT